MKGFEKGSERRRLLISLLAADGALLGTGVLLLLLSHFLRPYGLYFCPLARYGHLYCPACGGTRAIEALLRLDILASLRYHPVGSVLVFAAGYYNFLGLRSLVSGDMRYIGRARPWPILAVAAVMLLHFAVRNLLLVFFGIDPIGDLLPYYG